MDILDRLKEKFDIAEPIFEYELFDLGYSMDDIESALKEDIFEELFGVDFIPCRIFYLVGYSEFLRNNIKLYNRSTKLVEKYFLGNDFEFGFYFGLTLQNRIGLSTQMPLRLYIQSNRVTEIVDRDFFYVKPNICYKRCDLDYICLAEILKFNGTFDYDISETLKKLRLVCTDSIILNRYLNE